MTVITSPHNDHVLGTVPSIFLAGCANNDWRKEFVKIPNLTPNCVIYDPKRDDFDQMSSIDKTQQIVWEIQKLKKSDILVFHFNAGSVCPITLLEYGLWGLSSDKPLAVYVAPDYEKREDVITQTGIVRPDVEIFDDERQLQLRTKALLGMFS